MSSFLIKENDIHIWVQKYKPTNKNMFFFFKSILSFEEKKKIKEKSIGSLKEEFIIGKGSLRYLLQNYLNIPAQYIRFDIGPYGKPNINHPLGLKFNISHSGEMWVLGLTKNREIGIDIELINDSSSYQLILDMVLSETEKKYFFLLCENDRDKAFFDIWTKKEALLKAIGVGLSIPMTAIEVFGQQTENKNFYSFCGNKKFKLINIVISSKYSTNLAVEGNLGNIKIFQFNDLFF